VQRDAAEGLGDVDAHRADAMVCGSSPSERAWRIIVGVSPPAQLQAVHLARVGKVARVRITTSPERRRGAARRTGSRANAHGGDDVRQRLGELVDELLVPCRQPDHGPPLWSSLGEERLGAEVEQLGPMAV